MSIKTAEDYKGKQSVMSRRSVKSKKSLVKKDDSPVMQLFLDEDRESGEISARTIARTLKALGGFVPIFLITLTAFFSNILDYLTQFEILDWTKISSVDAEDPLAIRTMWMAFIYLQARNILNAIRGLACYILTVKAARRIHAKMSFRFLHSKIGDFLERVPAGRIINRFTKDINNIDVTLNWNLNSACLDTMIVLVDLIMLVYSAKNPYLAIPCLLFIFASIKYQRIYMRLKREIVRLQNITNSPVIGWSIAVLKSSPEVRTLGKLPYVREKLKHLIDENTKNSVVIFGLDAWFQIRLAFMNMLLVQVPSYGYILYNLLSSNESVDIKNLIVFILSTSRLTADTSTLLINLSNMETNLVSVERCQKFEMIEPEENYKRFEEEEKKFTFPKKGVIRTILRRQESAQKNFPLGKVELRQLTAQYPTKNTPVLKDLNLLVNPGEKIGIVGRTGAGKTSFIKLFWNCLGAKSGKLLIDEKDISVLDLKALRSEIMVITQETALFQGSLRENIDPNLEYLFDKTTQSFKTREKQILKILEDLGFSKEKLDKDALDFKIEFEGNNLSLGEKQIVCFMRALVDKKKVIILDEATANIDLKTEESIQKRVEEDFGGCTMFVIAHRIQTVLNCDKILVLDQGEVLEFGAVQDLIRDESSEFYGIYKKLVEAKKNA